MRTTGLAFVVALAVAGSAAGAPLPLSPVEELGKKIFFDQGLSLNQNQSCAACHAPEVGWTGPDAAINLHGAVYEGSIPGAFGNRKPPSAAYGGASPIFYQNKKGGWVGGMFWDGRATGWRLGAPLAEQAQGPFLNPKEQALPSAASVVGWICSDASGYWDLFLQVWGADACAEVARGYDFVGFSVAAYEQSAEVSPFDSTFDRARKGEAALTQQEQRGFSLFRGKGKCARCHVSEGQRPLFTDYTYDNLGVPKNPENPFYATDATFVDEGLGGFLRSLGYPAAVYGKGLGNFKVPTLRNVDKRPAPEFVKAYGHNGYFKSLKGIVHFYNTRDVLPVCGGNFTEAQALASGCWPHPEFPANMNTAELGNLGLTAEEEDDLVAFLGALTDETTVAPPAP